MKSFLWNDLPSLLPLACAWAEQQAELIRGVGRRLQPADAALAAAVGVQRPDMVRIVEVAAIPGPRDPALRAACERLGFLGDDTAGLTLGYGVFLRRGSENHRRLLAHELRHVAQYEEHGSIADYLTRYITDLLSHGYWNAPLERDAAEAERFADDDG